MDIELRQYILQSFKDDWDVEFTLSVINTGKKEFNGLVSSLQEYVNNGDFELGKRCVHKLYGSMPTVGVVFVNNYRITTLTLPELEEISCLCQSKKQIVNDWFDQIITKLT